MPTHKPLKDEQDQIGIQNFALFFRRGREKNGLSQQNYHVICQILGIDLYNSQVSHIEQGVLVLKPRTFKQLDLLNQTFGNKKLIPPTQKNFSQEVREKFLKATPYLNENSEPCDAYDFFGIFTGLQGLHDSYVGEQIELTEEMALNIGKFERHVYSEFCIEKMVDPDKGWKMFEPELSKKLSKTKLAHLKKVLSGWAEWSLDDIKKATNNGREKPASCEINECFEKVMHKKLPCPIDIWTKGDKIKYKQLEPLG